MPNNNKASSTSSSSTQRVKAKRPCCQADRIPINAKNGPPAPGASQGMVNGGLLWTEGVEGVDPRTGLVVSDDPGVQTTQTLRNIQAIARKAGTCVSNAIKVSIYVTDIKDLAKVNEAYLKFFVKPLPPRTVLVVAKPLPSPAVGKPALVLIEAVIALCPRKQCPRRKDA